MAVEYATCSCVRRDRSIEQTRSMRPVKDIGVNVDERHSARRTRTRIIRPYDGGRMKGSVALETPIFITYRNATSHVATADHPPPSSPSPSLALLCFELTLPHPCLRLFPVFDSTNASISQVVGMLRPKPNLDATVFCRRTVEVVEVTDAAMLSRARTRTRNLSHLSVYTHTRAPTMC